MTSSARNQPIDTLQTFLISQPQFLRELLAGGVAGGLSKTSVAPLERTKILLQTGRTQSKGILGTLYYVWETEGVLGLYRGNSASVLRIVPYAAIHFSAYEWYRRLLVEHAVPVWESRRSAGIQHNEKGCGSPVCAPNSSETSAPQNNSQHAPPYPHTSVVAGPSHLMSSNITHPLQKTQGSMAGPSDQEELAGPSEQVALAGPSGQESLIGPSAGQEPASGSAMQVSSLGRDGGAGKRRPEVATVHPVWDLLAGSMAGATAVMLTYPLDLVRARLAWATGLSPRATTPRLAAASSSAFSAITRGKALVETSSAASFSQQRQPTIRGELSRTFREGGVLGLYRGMSPTLMGILPYAGLKFYCYQSLKAAYHKHQGQLLLSSSSSKDSTLGLEPDPPAASSAAAATGSKKLPVAWMLLFGGVSGLVAQTVTYPLDVIRRRMQVLSASQSSSSGSSRSSAQVNISGSSSPCSALEDPQGSGSSRSSGAACTTAGRAPSSSPAPVTCAAAANSRLFSSSSNVAASSQLEFQSGPATSTASAQRTWTILSGYTCTSSGPFSNGSNSTMHQTAVSVVGRLTTWSILKGILVEEGLRGLFRGVSLNYIKAMPSTAIGFTVYDQLKTYLHVEGHL